MAELDHDSIAELIDRAREGDTADVQRLFHQCRNYVAVIAQAQMESWMRAKVDASDIVQETLLEAHRDFRRFKGSTEAEWLAWLRQIVSHNAADVVRRYRGTQKRQQRKELPIRPIDDESFPRGAPEPVDPAASPSQLVMGHERQLQVVDALCGLSEDHREVIMLRNLERLPFDEVARRMGRSRPAVQMLWMRAVKKLQRLLKD